MQLVDNDTFLQRLNELFASSVKRGTIWLTHKRLTYEDGDISMKAVDGSADTKEYPCLLRATNGDDIKFSTTVQPGELNKFYSAYGTLLKSSMGTLRKRDKKREKMHSEEAAKRKKRMTDPITIDGPKRGNGRRSRQRKIHAALKQQASQAKFKERESEAAKKGSVVP
ncbi:signal recognition particle, SRP9/SRP14 subunit [Pleurotus eryngii]|uniref:Signal recognition particle subunit SRP14 n=1 Tax=Pleurotus eryngii TaxID=5323 RepID=A0A9P6D7B3_PLEER|nr:signal recognition particle, SRP9/SRP14 subunit [Pleurotus eryngii]